MILSYTKIILDGGSENGKTFTRTYNPDKEAGIIFTKNGNLTITTDAVLQNSKPTTDARGGAVFVCGGSMTMNENAVIRNCEAGHGGGVHVGSDYADSKSTVTIEGNARIENSKAKGWGGGIFCFGNTETTVRGNAVIIGCQADADSDNQGDGGGIDVSRGGEFTFTGNAKILDCSAYNGGAINVESNGANNTIVNLSGGLITGNSAENNGAGICLSAPTGTIEAVLNISGNPQFTGTYTKLNGTSATGLGNFRTGTTDKVNGGAAYPKPDGTNAQLRQDIYIAGYIGTKGGDGTDKNDPKMATSLRVTGNLTSAEGSIWVWAEETSSDTENNHYKQLKQFAKFELPTGVTLTEAQQISSMKVFRNAVSDDLTEAGEVLLGQFGEDDNTKTYIYWSGVAGSRKVILRKVDTEYTPVKEKTFVLCKGSNTSAYVVKDGDDRTQLGGTLPANSQGVALDPMESLDSGVIWIGSLPYGWYILEETVAEGETPKYFYLVVTANGTFGTSEAADGYSDRTVAETKATAVYNANK